MGEFSLDDLPPDVRRDAVLYIEFLLKQRNQSAPAQPMQFAWAGGLREFKEEYTSLELQRKANEWR